jgi:thiamine biosynthesis lipoprotein
MGTVFSFDIRDRPTVRVRHALQDAVRWLHRMDAIFSTYRQDSAISRLDRGETTLDRCPHEVADVLALCDRATAATRGYFTSRAAGRLDPSGLVKGWAIERAAGLLRAAGAHNTYVNGGGDLQVYGEAAPGEPWRIGVAHPHSPRRLVAVVPGSDIAVATSGTAERGAHIFDPHTGQPAGAWLSLTVVGPRIGPADVFATAAFAMGDAAPAWIAEQQGYEAIGIRADGSVWYSDGFPPQESMW